MPDSAPKKVLLSAVALATGLTSVAACDDPNSLTPRERSAQGGWTELCTGVLTARELGIDRGCVSLRGLPTPDTARLSWEKDGARTELSGDATISLSAEGGISITLEASESELAAGPLSDQYWGSGGAEFVIRLTPRHAVRREGSLAHHYVGSLEITPLAELGVRGQQADVHRGLHFYADAGHDEAPHWGYHGGEGPDHWSDLSPEFEACDGTAQSPVAIDIGRASLRGEMPIQRQYGPSHLSLVNNGHTLMASTHGTERENVLVAAGQAYELLQFHIHSPSEHVVVANGVAKEYPLEIHFVHALQNSGAEKPELAVVGVFADVADECPDHRGFAGALANALPKQNGRAVVNRAVEFPENVDPALLWPQSDFSVASYRGSLTTPPCDERVNWYVIQEPQCVTKEELRDLRLYLGTDNARRPIPELGARALEFFAPN